MATKKSASQLNTTSGLSEADLQKLETALVTACVDGNIEACQATLDQIQQTCSSYVNWETVEDLIGYAFTRAAGANQVDTLKLLLVSPTTSSCVRYGICRVEKYFPRKSKNFHCCFALSYLGYAAIVCVEQNAVHALRLLVEKRLLMDKDITRCFQFTLQKAADFDASNPATYRPILMLLLHHYPFLLQTLCVEREDKTGDDSNETREESLMKALQSSLLYEYVVNHVKS